MESQPRNELSIVVDPVFSAALASLFYYTGILPKLEIPYSWTCPWNPAADVNHLEKKHGITIYVYITPYMVVILETFVIHAAKHSSALSFDISCEWSVLQKIHM